MVDAFGFHAWWGIWACGLVEFCETLPLFTGLQRLLRRRALSKEKCGGDCELVVELIRLQRAFFGGVIP